MVGGFILSVAKVQHFFELSKEIRKKHAVI
jgi:hypothetical protein